MTASWAASVGISICWTNRFRARQATALNLSHKPATRPRAAPPANRFQGFIPGVAPSLSIGGSTRAAATRFGPPMKLFAGARRDLDADANRLFRGGRGGCDVGWV